MTDQNSAPEFDPTPWEQAPRSRSTRRRTVFARQRLFMLGVVVASVAAGDITVRAMARTFTVRATLMLPPAPAAIGSTQHPVLSTSDDWVQLLKSNRVTDGVVQTERLFLETADEDDREFLRGLTVDFRNYLPARYVLLIDRARRRWTLEAVGAHRASTGGDRLRDAFAMRFSSDAVQVADSGAMTDSVGLRFGMMLQLDKSAFAGAGTRIVRFSIKTPREAALQMLSRLKVVQKGQFLQLSLEDTDPVLAENIVNAWANDFVSLSLSLRQNKVDEEARFIDARLKLAKDSLDAAEVRLASANGEAVDRARLRSREEAAIVYEALANRAAETSVARATTIPNLILLDSAIAPLSPNGTPPIFVLGMALLGGIVAAVGLAKVVDTLQGHAQPG